MAKSITQRRADLEAAKDQFRRRPKARLTWDEIAALWGITKPAMHNLHKTIDGFPEYVEKEGNTFFYPAYKVVCCLLAYMDRKVTAERAAAQRFQDLVRPAPAAKEEGPAPMTAAEQLKAYELRQKLIDEEIANGVLHRADHCAAVADRVFSIISRTFGSKVSDSLDPNGEWPAEVRTANDRAGEALVLQCFGEMKHMLSPEGATPDADQPDPGPARTGGKGRGPRARGKARKG